MNYNITRLLDLSKPLFIPRRPAGRQASRLPRRTGCKVVVGATPSRYASGQALTRGRCLSRTPRRMGGDYYALAKTQSLPIGKQVAKKLWSARYDFRRPLRPACGRQAWRHCELFFFSFFFSQRRIDLSAAADRRKGRQGS